MKLTVIVELVLFSVVAVTLFADTAIAGNDEVYHPRIDQSTVMKTVLDRGVVHPNAYENEADVSQEYNTNKESESVETLKKRLLSDYQEGQWVNAYAELYGLGDSCPRQFQHSPIVSVSEY